MTGVVPHLERRSIPRREPPEPNAVRLLEEVPPHELPDELVAQARIAAGCDVALYVVDIGGSVMRQVAGSLSWPPELALDQGLGPELPRGRMGDAQESIARLVPGAVAVPLWLHGRAVAVLMAAETPAPALEPLSRQAAAAVELADRYTDVFHRARRREPTTPAAEIQENLLPPRLARLHRAELAAGIVPAYAVGGDWYDYAQNPECAWVAVGDAAGKGSPAAGASTIALGALRAARRGGLGLGDTARCIDAAVRELDAPDTFVTAILASWHPQESLLRWLRFGHPHPLLAPASGPSTLLEDRPSHLPLGLLLGGEALEPSERRLAPGDRVVIMSDGVADRRTPNRGFFGTDGIRAAVESVPGASAAETATALVSAVMGALPTPPRDDATVLVLAAAA